MAENFRKINSDAEYAAAVLALSILLGSHPNRKQITSLILSITHYVGEVAEREGRDKAEIDAL